MKKCVRLAGCIFFLFLLLDVPPLQAVWVTNGSPISTDPADQGYDCEFHIASDGALGALIAWEDWRNHALTGVDVYAQRIDPDGNVLWTVDGVAACTAPNDQIRPVIMSDGAGGAYIAYGGFGIGFSQVYIQWINAAGNPQWGPNGMSICSVSGGVPSIVSDGAGGAIVCWLRTQGGRLAYYAQWVDATGTPRWTADGVPFSTALWDQSDGQAVSDGSGGVILTWRDNTPSGTIIYVQRLDDTGAQQWGQYGKSLCAAVTHVHDPQIISDEAGGAIITWWDDSVTAPGIYALRIDHDSAFNWGPMLVEGTGDPDYPTLVGDGAEGCIITWQAYRNPPTYPDIYAQWVDDTGTIRWGILGATICERDGPQYWPYITSDGGGGAIITWYGAHAGPTLDITAQWVDDNGDIQWGKLGKLVCDAAASQGCPQVVPSGAGNGIIVWVDERIGNSDIYAMKVENGKQCSDFDDGTLQGWVMEYPAGGTISNPGSGGNPGGYLKAVDGLSGGGGIPIVAPGQFNGDLSGCFLEWDEYIFPSTAVRSTYVYLTGGPDGTRYSQVSRPEPVVGEWRHRYVPLVEPAWQTADVPPDFSDVIQDVTALRWEMEMHSGLGNEAGIDNVCLTCLSNICWVVPDSLDFGSFGALPWRDMSFTIYNTFEANTLVGTVSESSPHYSILSGGGPYSLAPGEYLVVTVRFEPASNGTHECTIETGDALCTDVFCRGSYVFTAVQLASFSAVGRDGYVDVEWTTATELNNAGFNVYRSSSEDGAKTQLNDELLPAKGDELQGATYTYRDYDVVARGGPYYYWFEDVGLDGKKHMSNPVKVDRLGAPSSFSLAQNTPNPFNPSTIIKYNLAEGCHVKLEVFNTLGQRVVTLVDEHQTAGSKAVQWNAGLMISSGIYFYRLQAGSFVETKKMVVIK